MTRVLIVDPDVRAQEHIRHSLTVDDACSVDGCESGEAALDRLEQDTYDAVISEIDLPGLSGLELLARIRESDRPIPVVIHTSTTDPRAFIAALNTGAAGWVAKEGDPRAEAGRLADLIGEAIRASREDMAIRVEAEQYRNVVESQTEFVCRFRPDGTHVFVNDAYAAYFGMAPEDLIGSVFRPEIPAGDRGRLVTHLASLTPDHPVDTIRHRIIMPDGTTRWQSWNDRAIFDEDGRVVEYQSVGRDVTDVVERERALREDLERYASVVHFLPDPALAIDREGRVVAWNRAMEDLTGVPADEMLGKGDHAYAVPFYGERRPILIDLVGVREDELPDQLYTNLKMENGSLSAETTLTRIRNEKRVLWGKAGALLDRAGERIGAIEIIRDITERKYFEELYRGTMEHAGTAIIVFDGNGTLLAVNRKAEELSGYPREETVGKKTWIEFVDPADRERMVGYHRLREQHPDQAPEEYEFRMIDRDGERHHILLNVGAMGHAGCYIASLTDITGRNQAEQALRSSEERFHGLFTHMPAGVAIYDVVGDGEDFVFADFNPAAETILRIRKKEVIGRSISEIFPGAEEFGIVDVLRQVWETGEPAHIPAAPYRDERIQGWLENDIFRLSPGGVVAIFSDVTEKKHAEEALRRAHRQLQILTGITRHDILNSVMVAAGYLDLMEEADPGTWTDRLADIRRMIGQIEHQITFTREYQSMGQSPPSWQRPAKIIGQYIQNQP